MLYGNLLAAFTSKLTTNEMLVHENLQSNTVKYHLLDQRRLLLKFTKILIHGKVDRR